MSNRGTDFENSLSRVREILSNVNVTKSQDAIVGKALLAGLSSVLASLDSVDPQVLLSTSALALFEDVCANKFLVLGRCLQSLLVSIYGKIVAVAPGYVVRNVMNSMLNLCNNKAATASSRECSTLIIGCTLKSRSLDCGSILGDLVQCLVKQCRAESQLRVSSLKAASDTVNGAGSIGSDFHLEFVKLAAKFMADRSSEVRMAAAVLLESIASQPGCYASVPPETLVTATSRGLEDENVSVQDISCRTFAAVFVEQVRVFQEQAEKAKIGAARGGSGSENDSANQKKKPSRLSIPKLSITSQRKLLEEFDLKSVATHFFKNILKSNGQLRTSHLLALGYFIREVIMSLDSKDLEWLVQSLLSQLRDPALASVSFEEAAFFRTRLAMIFGSSITGRLSEPRLGHLATILIQYVSSLEPRCDNEMQLALTELANTIFVLCQAAAFLVDDVQAAITVHLRHSCFGVRSAAAHVLLALARSVPGIASDVLRTSLSNAQSQVLQLSKIDAPIGTDPGFAGSGDSQEEKSDSTRKKSPREIEKIQRLHSFHGHALVLSLLLKHCKELPSGLPTQQITEIIDFGAELLQTDVASVALDVKNVACSFVRAGSLIVSSALHMGYEASRFHLMKLLLRCDSILKQAASTDGSPSPTNKGSDVLLYELMTVEAALVCISALLWFCPNALEHEPGCLDIVVECLELGFRTVKSKYQPKFRGQFRFRTLHTILMECFAWLPPGSFPSCCQQVFVEALRVFRDSVSSFESTYLNSFLKDEYLVLSLPANGMVTTSSLGSLSSGQRGLTLLSSSLELPESEEHLFLRLETFSFPISKKETEAFLASFGAENALTQGKRTNYLPGIPWKAPLSPCLQIDARTVDAAIVVLGATFGHQSIEFQEKGIQLCASAIGQLAKSSLGVFASDEEKKKRDRKSYLTTKNVSAVLSCIIDSFPFEMFITPSFHLSWSQTVVDMLSDMVGNQNLEVCAAASRSLARLSSHMTRSSLLDSVFSQFSSNVLTASEKKGESLAEFTGTALAFSDLWAGASSRPNLKKAIVSNLLEVLRKTETAAIFRACGIFSLKRIVAMLFSLQLDTTELLTIYEKVCHVVEVNVAALPSASEESDILFCTLQQLSTETVVSILQFAQDSGIRFASCGTPKDDQSIVSSDIEGILVRFYRVWDVILLSCEHCLVKQGHMEFLARVCVFRHFLERYSPNCCMDLVISSLSDVEAGIKTLQAAMVCATHLASEDAGCGRVLALNPVGFELLNWCYSNESAPSAVLYAGLDIRVINGLGKHLRDGFIHHLGKQCRELLTRLACILSCHFLDSSAHAVLFYRAVSLGLTAAPVNSSADEAAEVSDAAGEDDDVPRVTTSPRKKEAPRVAISSPAQFAAWCKANASALASSSLNVVGVRLKEAAVCCAAEVLRSIGSNTAHSSIERSRAAVMRSLPESGLLTELELLAVPCHASLFLQDIVNFACAAATYTVNDKQSLMLQEASMKLLTEVVRLFGNTLDPDVLGEEGSAGNRKILFLSISQILSAVRPGLGCRFNPELAFTSGHIVCELLRLGFLEDRVAVKRTVKLLLQSSEDADGSNQMSFLHARAVLFDNCSEEFSLLSHFNSVNLAAILFLVTQDVACNIAVTKSTRSLILSTLQENLPAITEAWVLCAIDATRLLLSHSNIVLPTGEEDVPSARYPKLMLWPPVTPSIDSRRGGSVFLKSSDSTVFQTQLQNMLPNLLAAATLSPRFQAERLSFLFAASQSALAHFFSEIAREEHVVQASFLIAALSHMASSELDIEEVLDLSDWSRVAKQFETVANSRPARPELLMPILDCLERLAARCNDTSSESNERLWHCLWSPTVAVLKRLVPYLFHGESTDRIMRIPSVASESKLSIENGVSSEVSMPSLSAVVSDISSKALQLVKATGIIVSLSRFQHDSQMFCLQLVTTLIPVVGPETNQLRNALSHHLSSLTKQFHSRQPKFGLELLHSIETDFLCWLTTLRSETSSDVPSLVVSNLVDEWKEVLLAVRPEAYWPSFGDYIYRNRDRSSLVKSSLRALSRIAQSDVFVGEAVSVEMFPVTLSLVSDKYDDEIQLLAMQFGFLCFQFAEDKTTFLGLLLPPVCSVISRRESTDQMLQFSGKAFTHLARNFPDDFRSCVGNLTNDVRLIVQNAMKTALESESVRSTAAGGSAAGSGTTIKKLDIAKFKGK